MHPTLALYVVNELQARRAAEAHHAHRSARPSSVSRYARVKGLFAAISPFSASPSPDYGPKLEFGAGYPYR